MSALQAALIGVVAALSVLEGGWLGECKLREPVVTGFLVGLIFIFVPFKFYCIHNYIIIIFFFLSNFLYAL